MLKKSLLFIIIGVLIFSLNSLALPICYDTGGDYTCSDVCPELDGQACQPGNLNVGSNSACSAAISCPTGSCEVTYAASYQATETFCDNVDNDCDGLVDETCFKDCRVGEKLLSRDTFTAPATVKNEGANVSSNAENAVIYYTPIANHNYRTTLSYTQASCRTINPDPDCGFGPFQSGEPCCFDYNYNAHYSLYDSGTLIQTLDTNNACVANYGETCTGTSNSDWGYSIPELASVSINAICSGGNSPNCEPNEEINMVATFSSDCSLANNFQIDASNDITVGDAACDIEFQQTGGIEITNGVNSNIALTSAQRSVSASWIIPDWSLIPVSCYDKTIFSVAGAFWTGLPGSGSQIVNSIQSGITPTGSFIFSNPDNICEWRRLTTFTGSGDTNKIIEASNGELFVATTITGKLIMSSTDNGITWNPKQNGISGVTGIYSILNSNGVLYAGANNGNVFKSSDNGASWQSAGSAGTEEVYSLTDFNGNIYAGTDSFTGRVYRYDQAGNTWTYIGDMSSIPGEVADFIAGMDVFSDAVVGTALYGVGNDVNFIQPAYVKGSRDSGVNWFTAGKFFGEEAYVGTDVVAQDNLGNMYVGLSSPSTQQIYVHKSINRFSAPFTWTLTSALPSSNYIYSLFYDVIDNILYVSSDGSTQLSTDYGNSWQTKIVETDPLRLRADIKDFVKSSSGSIYATAKTGGTVSIYKLPCVTPTTSTTTTTTLPVQSNCGNGIVDAGETCDGTNFGPITGCGDFDSFTGGTLNCDANCKIDTSLCIGGTAGSCPDGNIDIGETCDGSNLDGKTCSNFDSFDSGTLSCDFNCDVDTSLCTTTITSTTTTTLGNCGNGILDDGETCDLALSFIDLGLECSDFGNFDNTGGNLVCDPTTCQIDTSQCACSSCGPQNCLNGIIEPGEQCDGSGISLNCNALGYDTGDLSCDSSCNFDTTDCRNNPSGPVCGDGNLDTSEGEQCDGYQNIGQCGVCCQPPDPANNILGSPDWPDCQLWINSNARTPANDEGCGCYEDVSLPSGYKLISSAGDCVPDPNNDGFGNRDVIYTLLDSSNQPVDNLILPTLNLPEFPWTDNNPHTESETCTTAPRPVPVFTWINVLFVIAILISYYIIKIKRSKKF